LATGHVVALAGEPERIWIATLEDGLIRYQAGAITRLGEQEGLPDRRLLSLAAAGDSVFAGTAVGIAQIEDGAWRRTLGDGFFASALWSDGETLSVGTLEEGVAEIPLGRSRTGGAPRPVDAGPGPVRRLVDLDDELYALTPEAVWQREPDGAWRVAVEPPKGLTDRNVSALHRDSSGRLWVGYFDRGLDLFDGENIETHVEDDVVYCVNRIVEDPDKGLLAVATANGLVFLDSAGRPRQTLRRADGLMADHVTDLVFRNEGWVAANPTGLTFFDAAGLRGLYALHGLVNNHVYTLAARGETLLAGTLGGLSVLEGGVVRQSFTTANSPLGHNWIAGLADFRGDWFIGTYGAGVAKLSSDGTWRSFDDMAGVEINPNAMAISAEHVYAGTLDRGLLVYFPEREQWQTVTQGLPSANITALAYSGGTLYVGTDNGLARIAEESISLP
jgi:ligand-binding sensor domain-containing protein